MIGMAHGEFDIFEKWPDEQNVNEVERQTVLVVDDDRSIREALKIVLRDEYNVTSCQSGTRAIEEFHEGIYVIILDIRMEGKDGFEAYLELKKKAPYIPIIFYSAYQDLKDPFDIMNEFHPFGYVIKGSNYKFLLDLVKSATDYYQKIQENQKLILDLKNLNNSLEEKVIERTATITQQKNQLEHQMDLARQIQESLLPSQVPEITGAVVGFQYRPMMEVGGDFVDILYRYGEPHLGVFICDVSGHGVPAAFLSSMIKMSLNDWDNTVENPTELLYSIERNMRKKMGTNFLTACAGHLNLETGRFTYSSAGHPPPILISGGRASYLERKGGAIWEIGKAEFVPFHADLKPGDRIVLYTDGISEAYNDLEGRMMEDDEFLSFFAAIPELTPSDFCHHVVEEIVKFTGSMSDDLSILAFDYTG